MLGDVETERLLLQAQQLVLLELVRGDVRVVLGRRFLRTGLAEIEDRPLPRDLVRLRAAAPGQSLLHAFEHPAPRRPGRVERAALDQGLQSPFVRTLRIDSLGEIPQRLERSPLLACRNDRTRGRVAHVLDRVQPEPNLPLDDREVVCGRVHVRRQHLDPHLRARGDVERHPVLRVHHGRDQRGHVLPRVIGPQPRRPVRDQRVAGRV